MKDFKISLAIPAHNEEKYIGECLDSAIKNSGGRFFEIIVVNNFSTDKTEHIAKGRKGVTVINHDKQGVTLARNRGFHESKGDLVAYIDADNRIPEGWYDSVIKEFADNPDLVLLSGPYTYYDFNKFQNTLAKIYWYLTMPFYWLIGYMAIAGNIVVRRDVLEKINGWDESIVFYGDDTDIARRASKFGKTKFKLGFVIHSSARRFSNNGLLKTTGSYVINFFSEVFLHKPISNKYKGFR
ncbi:MAG: glycosyltransferase family A protein [Candidatus Paceibacterota bacterium]|jgi:glycosyltransferase involved in cell wall biosynthesis